MNCTCLVASQPCSSPGRGEDEQQGDLSCGKGPHLSPLSSMVPGILCYCREGLEGPRDKG